MFVMLIEVSKFPASQTTLNHHQLTGEVMSSASLKLLLKANKVQAVQFHNARCLLRFGFTI